MNGKMNEKMYEKVNVKTAQKFKDAASWIVDHKCTTMDGSKIIGEHRDILIKEFDEKNRLLYVQVLREDINLKELSGDDFFVVTDLLFLINNLK